MNETKNAISHRTRTDDHEGQKEEADNPNLANNASMVREKTEDVRYKPFANGDVINDPFEKVQTASVLAL